MLPLRSLALARAPKQAKRFSPSSLATRETGGGPYSGRWGGVGLTETTVSQHDEGALVIDFVDAPKRRLAWRGSGTRRLASNPDPELVTKRVTEAVSEILAQFPPKKK